ncbi:hypothetical protein GCM10023159_08770 [Brevibacterium yomogidense]
MGLVVVPAVVPLVVPAVRLVGVPLVVLAGLTVLPGVWEQLRVLVPA